MKAYCTLLGSEDYLPGVLCLHRSLQLLATQYPFFVFVCANILASTRKVLEAENIQLIAIESIQFEEKEYIFERFANTWTKLALFDQTQFSRLVYLDADMLVLKNCDELFDLDLKGGLAMAAACTCNPLKKPEYPKHWQPETCFFNGGRAVSDFYGNSGLLVLEPHTGLLADMLAFLAKRGASAFPFPDQDFLNIYFNGKIKPLSYVYNTLKTTLKYHADVCNVEEVKVLHYILDKPWQKHRVNNEYQDLEALWWEVYEKEIMISQ